MGKVHAHLRLFREETMFAHFWPLIVREGATQLRRQRPEFARESLPHCGRVLRLQRYQYGKSCGPLTSVPSADALAWPTSKSPSQCPGTVRSATS